MTSVFNLGSICSMTVPSEWQAMPLERSSQAGQVSQPYTLKEDSDVTFSLYYRGKEVSRAIAEDFLAVLNAAPHDLSADEIETVIVVLRHMSEEDFFKPDYVRTVSLGGRTVLTVEGVWTASDLKNLGVFLCGNESGTIVDELHYYAPIAKYDAHMDKARAILNSIRFDDAKRKGP
ncbi:MAG: hypothetical protein KGS72_07755 [Cyanobacteria bacterium REEB67]|nr:hypothetical protein [Cyanobacteria bacterium REEB67]